MGFESSIEKLIVKIYGSNLSKVIKYLNINLFKGKEIMEFFIEDLIKSGVTYVPPYVEPKVEILENSLVNNEFSIEKSNSDTLKSEMENKEKDNTNKLPDDLEGNNPQKEHKLQQVIRRKSRNSISGNANINNNMSSFDERKFSLFK